jgi:hypothetical protein
MDENDEREYVNNKINKIKGMFEKSSDNKSHSGSSNNVPMSLSGKLDDKINYYQTQLSERNYNLINLKF